jgi:hypothetical protein
MVQRAFKLGIAFCRDGRIRTCGLHIPNVARYRATLHPVKKSAFAGYYHCANRKTKPSELSVQRAFTAWYRFSRDGRIRTCGLHIPNVARYRATLHPVSLIGVCKSRILNQVAKLFFKDFSSTNIIYSLTQY